MINLPNEGIPGEDYDDISFFSIRTHQIIVSENQVRAKCKKLLITDFVYF